MTSVHVTFETPAIILTSDRADLHVVSLQVCELNIKQILQHLGLVKRR